MASVYQANTERLDLRGGVGTVPVRLAGSPRPLTELTYPAGALLIVAGIPGAGKSTLLRRLFPTCPPLVLDPEHIHARYRAWFGIKVPYRLYRPFVHLEHYLRLACTMRVQDSVVAHETGTRRWMRRWIVRRASNHGRPVHLILLDVDLEVARQGQRQRGRQVPARSVRRHWRAWQRLRSELDTRWRPHRAGGLGGLWDEGYRSVVVLDRATAEQLQAVRFV